jgi:very-short-patch-repair endonuclease
MNFGPMNREGGERRLNVAITRARREVLVFSTLKADQIDLARTRAKGVKDLKRFLDFADRGIAAISEATEFDHEADFDSPFEEAVHDVLVQRGWEVHKQVGCARYRIDLAVVDPTAAGRYLMGVECDGANYHRAKTARDRDKLREGILRDLGWKLHRIWSTDWWTDPDREIRRLEEALATAKQGGSTPPAEGSVGTGVPPRQEPSPKQPAAPLHPMPAPAESLALYRPFTIERLTGSPADFYENAAVRQIRSQILEVVAQEGPVSLALAARRVAEFWGFERVRSQVVDRIRELVPLDKVRVEGGFLWPTEVSSEQYNSFRVPSADAGSARAAEDLPVEEIANAVVHVLRVQIGAPVGDVVRETARLFAFQRTGRLVEERIHLGVDLSLRRGRITRIGDQLTTAD